MRFLQRLPLIVGATFCCLPVASAEEVDPLPEKRGMIVSARAGDIRRHRPGAWTVLNASAANHSDQDEEGMVAAYFPPNIERQFARRMWVPAHAYRQSWLPIQFPAGLPRMVWQQNLATVSIASIPGNQVFQRHEGDPVVNNLPMLIEHDSGHTAVYLRNAMPDENNFTLDLDTDALDTIITARRYSDLSPLISELSNDFQPPWPEVLQGFEQFVLTADRITNDSAGLSTLRAWVRNGGRLWIMLDRVSTTTVRAILGNAANFEVVDRVELDQFVITTTDLNANWPVIDKCDFEYPVEFVRVVDSTNDVTCRINGWPAAFWVPYGEGEILFTTLAPRGWRAPFGRAPTNALQRLSTRFFSSREGRVDPRGFQVPLQQQIGYRIPSRTVAVSILGMYCAVLLVGGGALARRHHLDGLAWLSPGVAVLTTAVLIWIGTVYSTSVPPTVALGQLLRFAPQTNEVRVDGLAAIYDHRSRPVSVSSDRRDWLLPEPPHDNEVRRLVWSDSDRLEPGNTSTNAGSIGLASFVGISELARPVTAEAEFGPEGLQGKIQLGSLRNIADPVVVLPPGQNLAVTLNSDGDFHGNVKQTLPTDRFVASTLLSDIQQRRQEYCRSLLNPVDSFVFPRRPSLLFWCEPLMMGVTLPDGYKRVGSALAMIPIELRRTPADSPFRVPSTFLVAEPAKFEQTETSLYNASIYNRRTGQWVQGLKSSAEVPLRFQLPSQVLPCQLTDATITVSISAPSRELQLWLYGEDRRELLRSFRNPIGVISIELGPKQLELDDRGGVVLGFAVTAIQTTAPASAVDSSNSKNSGLPSRNSSSNRYTAPQSTNNWQIDYVSLTVDGRTLPANE